MNKPLAAIVLACTTAMCAVYPALAQEAWDQVFRKDVEPPPNFRANRNGYSPIMDVLEASRPAVTDEQLDQLAALQIENIWDGLGEYQETNFVSGFQAARPGKRLVGRALTMRYLPPRPDLQQAAQQLAKEGDWDARFNIRAGEEASPRDVIVVEQGGPDGSIFLGDVSALAMALRGAAGAIVDGGARDISELRGPDFENFHVFARFFDARANFWVGADWNVPVRIAHATVMPGDIVIADESGVIFLPPSLVAPILARAAASEDREDYQRDLLKQKKYRIRDLYPLHPNLEKER